MFDFSSSVYIALILILSVLLLAMLIERIKIPRTIKNRTRELTQKLRHEHKQELELLRKQSEKKIAAIQSRAESASGDDRAKVDRLLTELEREREISRIASTVSNEQSKKIHFFTDLAQEFRTPLTSIMESLEDLLSGSYGKLQVKTRRQLELMLRNTRLLVRGMDLFHDISHLQSGKMEITRSRQDIVRFLREIVQTVAWYAEKKKIDLRLDTGLERVDVHFDAKKIAEVLYHLISNAFKFTGAGGKIWISVSDLPGNEDYEEEVVRIGIRNSGKVIPEEEIPFLFDPFHRSERNRPRFGLSLVKELISQHGGSIQVRSDPDIGTEFAILLPKGRPGDAEASADDKPFDLSQRARMELSMLESTDENADQEILDGLRNTPMTSGKILIVEDNESLRELLKSGLREYYAITEARNGIEALEKVQELKPDLVITDLMMPEMDGLNFCKQMKADADLHDIPIILITAKSSENGRLEGLEAGADAYIAKPFGFEELLRKVEHLTKNSVTK